MNNFFNDVPIISKPIKRYKQKFFLFFTWVDLLITTVLFMFATLVWVGMNTSLVIKISLTLLILMFLGILLCSFKERKLYLWSFHYFVCIHLKLKKESNHISKLEFFGNGMVQINSKVSQLWIEISGFNSDILQSNDLQFRIQNFRQSLKMPGVDIQFYKCNITPNFQEEIDSLEEKERNIDSHLLTPLRNKIDNIRELNNNLEEKYFFVLRGDQAKIRYLLPIALDRLTTSGLQPRVASKEILHSIYKYTIPNYKLDKSFKERKDFIKIHDEFYSFVSISEYPMFANLNWLSILNFSQDISWHMLIRALSKEESSQKIDSIIRNIEVNILNTKKDSDQVKNDSYLQGLKSLNVAINKFGETINLTTLTFMLRGRNLEDLEALKRKFISTLSSYNFKINNLKNMQRQGLKTFWSVYENALRKEIMTELSTSAIAFGLPFSANNLIDEGGSYIGYTETLGSIFFNPFSLKGNRKNSNCVMLGSSGSGKTFVCKKVIMNELLQGTQIVVIDAEKEYLDMSIKCGGKVVSLEENCIEKGWIINPLYFQDTSSSSLFEHLDFLEQFWLLLFPDLKLEEQRFLRQITLELYQTFETLRLSQNLINNFPTITDLIVKVRKVESFDSGICKDRVIRMLETFSSASSEQSIDLIDTTPFVAIDIHSLINGNNPRIQNAQLFLMFHWLNVYMMNDNSRNTKKKKVFLIDEAHLLLNDQYPMIIDFVYQIIKRARKYGTMIVLSTQNPQDFIGGDINTRKKTMAIINSCQYAFLLGMSPGDINDLDSIYKPIGGLSEIEKDILATAQKGKGIFVLGPKNKKICQVDLTDWEIEFFQDRKSHETSY